jgi:hypothetical protein
LRDDIRSDPETFLSVCACRAGVAVTIVIVELSMVTLRVTVAIAQIRGFAEFHTFRTDQFVAFVANKAIAVIVVICVGVALWIARSVAKV